MQNHLLAKVSYLLVSFCTVMILSGCGSVRLEEMQMLNDVQNELDNIANIPILIIQQDDILSIEVFSRQPQAVAAFNVGNPTNVINSATGVGASGLHTLNGYRVDEEGNIYLPYIGAFNVVNKTVKQVRDELTVQLTRYFDDISIRIRFLNFKVTILGEVNNPNVYIIPNERLNILEAIGMASDFTPYAQRNSVLLIRERGDRREFVRVNTQDKDLFTNPYFYLAPNDVLYIAPLKAKQYATRGDFFDRYGRFLIPFVSLATFLAGVLVR